MYSVLICRFIITKISNKYYHYYYLYKNPILTFMLNKDTIILKVYLIMILENIFSSKNIFEKNEVFNKFIKHFQEFEKLLKMFFLKKFHSSKNTSLKKMFLLKLLQVKIFSL